LSAEGLLCRIQGKGTFIYQTGGSHLLEHGYRRIAFISGLYCSSTGNRLNGYKKALEEAGLKVPLTTVRQPREEIWKRAVQLLQKRINNPDKKVEKIVLSAKLIIRESSVKKNGK